MTGDPYMKGATIREVANTYQDLCYVERKNVGMDDRGRYWALMDAPVYEMPRGLWSRWVGVGDFSHGGKIFTDLDRLSAHLRQLSSDQVCVHQHDIRWNKPQLLSDGRQTEEWFRLWEPLT